MCASLLCGSGSTLAICISFPHRHSGNSVQPGTSKRSNKDISHPQDDLVCPAMLQCTSLKSRHGKFQRKEPRQIEVCRGPSLMMQPRTGVPREGGAQSEFGKVSRGGQAIGRCVEGGSRLESIEAGPNRHAA